MATPEGEQEQESDREHRKWDGEREAIGLWSGNRIKDVGRDGNRGRGMDSDGDGEENDQFLRARMGRRLKA